MDIAVTTILLFAVFGILLFVGCPISVSIVVFINCNGLVFSVVGSDYIYHHAENERRSGEFLTVGCTAVYFGRKYYEQWWYCTQTCKLCKIILRMDTRISCPGKCTWKHAVRSSFWFRSSSFFCNGRMYLPNSERRRL